MVQNYVMAASRLILVAIGNGPLGFGQIGISALIRDGCELEVPIECIGVSFIAATHMTIKFFFCKRHQRPKKQHLANGQN